MYQIFYNFLKGQEDHSKETHSTHGYGVCIQETAHI